MGILNYYRPPTELREGNVFIPICLSISLSGGGGSHVTITHDTFDLTLQPLDRDPPASD